MQHQKQPVKPDRWTKKKTETEIDLIEVQLRKEGRAIESHSKQSEGSERVRGQMVWTGQHRYEVKTESLIA